MQVTVKQGCGQWRGAGSHSTELLRLLRGKGQGSDRDRTGGPAPGGLGCWMETLLEVGLRMEPQKLLGSWRSSLCLHTPPGRAEGPPVGLEISSFLAGSVVGRLHSPCPKGPPPSPLTWLRQSKAQARGQTRVPIWHLA